MDRHCVEQKETKRGEKRRERGKKKIKSAERYCYNMSFLGQSLALDNYGNEEDSRAQGVLLEVFH